jgi:hypothetical protein
MTTYLLGVQQESLSIRVALAKRANSGKTTLVTTATLPSQSFKTWLKEHVPSKAPVQAVLTVPESHIILKELELPILKGKELAEAVHWELTDKSSIDAESSVAWQVVEKRDSMLRVAAMIMKKAEVAAALTFFAEAGVELTAIEPSSISAGRVLTISGATNVLLSLEGAEVLAVFVRNRVPVFSTSFTIPLTDAAVRAKHFSRDATASLVSQLKRIITYWNAKNTPVSRIIVTSEAATYSGLKSDVARGLSIPLETAQADAAVIGAAKRVGDDGVNFLPKENRVSLEKKASGSYGRMKLWQFARVNIVVIMLLAALNGFFWITRMAYIKNILQTERFVDNHPAQKYVAHITSINGLIKDVATLIAGQEDTGTRLRYLSSVTPPNLHFTSLKMVSAAKEEWVISGTGDRRDILAFYYKLKADGTVKDVSMPYSNFDQESDSPFTVTIVW